jgi:hypothetical protein
MLQTINVRQYTSLIHLRAGPLNPDALRHTPWFVNLDLKLSVMLATNEVMVVIALMLIFQRPVWSDT